MATNSVSLYSLEYKQARTYGVAALFIAGNIALPQLCHLVPAGGPMLLPIYFFTNSALFAMPAAAALPAILTKSILLAAAAGFTARRFRNVSLMLLLGVVLFYQLFGSAVEWALSGSLTVALQDFRIGIPGMLLQIVGGYLLIKHLK